MDLNLLLEQMDMLITDGHEESLYAASNAWLVSNYNAEKLEYMADAMKKAIIIEQKHEGQPLAICEARAKTDKRYADKLEESRKANHRAEAAKAKYNIKRMEFDAVKIKISALQSQMKLV